MQPRVLCCGAHAQRGEEQRPLLDSLTLCHIAWQVDAVSLHGAHRSVGITKCCAPGASKRAGH